jgi:glutathione S-transferase
VNGEVPTLWHLKTSNFNEKARWALDYKGIPHRRIEPTPGPHMVIALALTRRVATLPVLKVDGRPIGDSTKIIAALEERVPDPPLYPPDPGNRQRALELEEFFDENLGPGVRCVAFSKLLGNPKFRGAGPAAIAPLIRRRYGVTERAATQSQLKVRAAMDLIADLLDGGDHLVGEQFTVADLAAAALLSPILGPPQLPYRDTKRRLPDELEDIVEEWRSLPAGNWVMRTYERYRPASVEVQA